MANPKRIIKFPKSFGQVEPELNGGFGANLLRRRQSNKRRAAPNFGELPEWKFEEYVETINNTIRRPFIIHEVIPLKNVCFRGESSNRTSAENLRCGREIGKTIIDLLTWEKETESSSYNQQKFKGVIFQFAIHKKEGFDHLHIVHDCTYGSRTCNCTIFNYICAKRYRQFRRRTPSSTSGFAKAITTYIIVRGGEDHFLYQGTGTCGFSNRPKHFRRELDGTEWEQILDEGCIQGNRGCSKQARCKDDRISDAIEERSLGQNKSRFEGWGALGKNSSSKKGKRELTIDAIINFLKNYMICPPNICNRTTYWLDHPILRYLTNSDRDYLDAMDIYRRLIGTLTIKDIYELYKDKEILAGTNPQSEDGSSGTVQFHTVEDSINILKKYLLFQFSHNQEEADKFMLYLYKLLTKNNGKKNALVIYGEPDGGKSYLVYTISCLMISVGNLTLMNKNNMFWGSSLTCQNLIVADEFNYDPVTFQEEVKKLFSGENTEVSVKYKDGQMVLKTPWIIMTNNANILPDIPVFNQRINKIRFNKIPNNGEFCRKLHPWSLINYWKEIGGGEFPNYEIMNQLTDYF